MQHAPKLSTAESASLLAGSVKRAVREFLLLPSVLIVGFLLLAAGTYAADSAKIAWLQPLRDLLRTHVFASSRATSDLLGAISAGIITLTSITISLLLVAVQQSAGAMTTQVFDQFLRRRLNQVYFGFFIGLGLFSLITLATVNDPFNPVIGATVSFAGTAVALYLLLLLLYTTINQMRPDEIVEAIHTHILLARERQLMFVARTLKESNHPGPVRTPFRSDGHGYVTAIDLDHISNALSGVDGEVRLDVSIGTFVAFGDRIAEVISAAGPSDEVAVSIRKAVTLGLQRDLDRDAGFGISQIETIAWTSISTSKSNPAPGLLALRSLRDIISRWAVSEASGVQAEKLPIVYEDDTVATLLDALESCAAVAVESLQHQTYAEVFSTISELFDRVPPDWQERMEDITQRIVRSADVFTPTRKLEDAMSGLGYLFSRAGRPETARMLADALARMKKVNVDHSRK